jgi:glycosyltransferase involved in cell wall biosynthesis
MEIATNEPKVWAPGAERLPTVGIVTPTLNAEKYLDLTLRSIWGQQGVRIDHVIVDGGSSDGTLDIAGRYPSRVIRSVDDQGMYDAINRGMAEVSGEIVGYLNADDEIAPGALELVSTIFARRPDVQWLFGTVEYVDGDGRLLGRLAPVAPSLRAYLGIHWSPIPQQTVWFRRSFFERVGPFDISYRNCGDYDWYARALKMEPPLVIRATLGIFRLHEGQISLNIERMKHEQRVVRERHGGAGAGAFLVGRFLSLRLNARNPAWLVAKKTGRIRFEPKRLGGRPWSRARRTPEGERQPTV